MKKRLLIISFSDLKNDPRVHRQIKFLRDVFDVTTAGFRDSEIEGVRHLPIFYQKASFSKKIYVGLNLLLRRGRLVEKDINSIFRLDIAKLFEEKFDLIIANDVDVLPTSFEIANGGKILLDAHEYSPRELEERLVWKIFWQGYKKHLCQKYLKAVNGMITVSDGISEEYYRNFYVRPDVVTNATAYHELKQSDTEQNIVKMIHHGGAISSRKIELMIQTMDYLDERFTLDLMLIPSEKKYFDKLRKMGNRKKNIRFLDPVPMQEIVRTINKYDLGLYLLPPNNFNNQHALPNKFFEFIQARLAVGIGPSPEMAKIVKRYNCGVVAEGFGPKSLAKELNKLTREAIEYYKGQSDKAAYELSEEVNLEKLGKIVSGLLNEAPEQV